MYSTVVSQRADVEFQEMDNDTYSVYRAKMTSTLSFAPRANVK